jgi:hypothetical protein
MARGSATANNSRAGRAAARLQLTIPHQSLFKEFSMALSEMKQTATSSIDEPWQHSEGAVARTIEDQTAKLPSDTFLWAAVAAMGGSLLLQATGRKHQSLFVGQWVAPFLLFGVYNKIVKVAGTDRIHA